MNEHAKKVSDIAIGELNRKNTYKHLDCPEFVYAGYRFRFGFWPSEINGELHPYMAMIVWTPKGWKTLDKGILLYNEDIRIDEASSDLAEDIQILMWHIGQVFTPAFVTFIKKAPVIDAVAAGDISMTPLERIIELLATARVTPSGELDFDRTAKKAK
tara:strand:- start:445 stop:918 length:474 start_codon:yes stop_codon:yes gene_type:complete